MVLLVPICRIRGAGYDPTCRLAPGEHSFIQEDSYFAYYFINQYSIAVLEQQLAQGIIRPNDPVLPALLERISDGVLRSRHCPPIERRYYQGRQNEAAG
jgi:hypothetical protein